MMDGSARCRRMFLAMVMVIGLGWGCAEAEFEEDTGLDAGPRTCESLSDCRLDELCADGLCVPPDRRDAGGDGGAVDAADGGERADGAGGGDAVGDGGERADGECAECGPSEVCEEGQCVRRCETGCTDGQKCRDLGEGYQCYRGCEELLTAEQCPREGTLCLDVDDDPQSTDPVCVESRCEERADCEVGGTCVRFPNAFGICARSGAQEVGDRCDTADRSKRCEPGAYCLEDGRQGSEGTCVKLCDPWASSPACGDGQRCGLFRWASGRFRIITLRQGFCNGNVDPSGQASLETCESPQNVCGHALRCQSEGMTNRCYKWCRPGEGDCATGEACNRYLFAGERRIGRCEARCEQGQQDCGSDRACVDGVCRRSCESASDCCAGPDSCDWSCNGGYCE